MRAAMEAAGETTYGLAKKSHVPRQTIDRKLGGGAAFNVAELDAIGRALGVSWLEFCKDAA